MRLRIVEAQGQGFGMGRAIGFELLQLGAPVPDFARNRIGVKGDPGVGTGEGMKPAAQMHFPVTQLEIEIVPAVPFRRGCRLCLAGLSLGSKARQVRERRNEEYQTRANSLLPLHFTFPG
jgi:hypothetical protein